MTRASRVAFVVAWLVFCVVAVLAWRRALSAPFGQSDVGAVFVGTLVGACALSLTGWWVSGRDSRRVRTSDSSRAEQSRW